MKTFLFVILLSSCTQVQLDLSKQAAQEIIEADKAMNEMAVKEGFHKTLLRFADDSLVKPQDGEFPVIGKKALEKYWSEKKETTAISWEPYKAEASKSGDMGYTLGNWKMITKDTSYYGNYYTFWKKHADGSWKFVVDGGNNTPVRVNEKGLIQLVCLAKCILFLFKIIMIKVMRKLRFITSKSKNWLSFSVRET